MFCHNFTVLFILGLLLTHEKGMRRGSIPVILSYRLYQVLYLGRVKERTVTLRIQNLCIRLLLMCLCMSCTTVAIKALCEMGLASWTWRQREKSTFWSGPFSLLQTLTGLNTSNSIRALPLQHPALLTYLCISPVFLFKSYANPWRWRCLFVRPSRPS